MKTTAGIRIAAAALSWSACALLGGCGEKIAIPQPKGLFSISAYTEDDRYPDEVPLQLAIAQGGLFVLTPDSLTKRDLEYGRVAAVGGFDQPTAMCVGDRQELVFVWEQGAGRVSWFAGTDLSPVGSTDLTGVVAPVAMAANPVGIEQVPGARTFLYLSDPQAGVIHRFLFDDFLGLSPYGILARSDGDAARFVHRPAGMATDSEDSLLVCDADTNRNWVIRFVSEPDLDDVTTQVGDQDPWRGHAALFHQPTCVPPAAADYVLGNAAGCGQSDWVGAPSPAEGEFHTPMAVAVDGLGRIFVADAGNDRIQVFTPEGDFDLLFGNAELTPAPASLGVVDVRIGGGAEDVDYGAYVFVVVPERSEVRKFISSEHYIYLHKEPPPPPN